MCGIFGVISSGSINIKNLQILANLARQRGKDSSGFISYTNNAYHVVKADHDIKKLKKTTDFTDTNLVMGHSRLITNGLSDNQPVVRNGAVLLHNGIIINEDEVWNQLDDEPDLQIDSEAILGVAKEHFDNDGEIETLADKIMDVCRGVMACALLLPEKGKVILFSNNGSLYVGNKNADIYFSSESFPLEKIECDHYEQVKNRALIFDIPLSEDDINIVEKKSRKENLIPEFVYLENEAKLLEYEKCNVQRCTKCILPETMPFIKFDDKGVCNYCTNYSIRNNPKPKSEIFDLVEPYRRKGQVDCIVPFSGGRDSCYGLYLIVKELGMNPIAYTYDWGMVTDLGRRNISRMCSKLGVENIIITDDISKKRRNIRLNLASWLKSPHLGMIALLTAGDKHFFRHVETVKRQTKINLNLWGVNPLEVTHFKTGFLGIPPDFEEKRVYSHGITKQLRYHALRTAAMFESPGYFNRSLWDTLTGEYYRSFTEKHDYYHIFDYWRWDEEQIDNTLLNEFDWEKAVDTSTTWRIGDGTAAIYNYIYYTAAGFTEHDTFRSNQIREGQIDRAEALRLVEDENRPRYQNIRWYLDTLGMDFSSVINTINTMPRLY